MFRLAFLNVFLSVLLAPLMMRCTDGRENPCDVYTNYTNEKDLVTLSPLKQSFQKGETIKLKFSLSSKLKVDTKSIDIFQSTKRTSGVLSVNLSELFKDNTVIFVKGNKLEEHKFSAIYNSTTDSYELEIDVVLNRQGIYSFSTFTTFQERESEDGVCVFISLITNIKENNSDDTRVEFVVN